jgi:hypothetical protein
VTQEPSRSGQDPIGDFQRWIFRSGARSVSREVSDQIRSALGVGGGPADVWAKATTPPADEAPECAWCPVCRAARVLRESGPGVSSQMSAAGEAMGVLARDAMSVSSRPWPRLAGRPGGRRAGRAIQPGLGGCDRADLAAADPGGATAGAAGAGQGQAPTSSVWADVTAADPEEPAPGPAEEPESAGPAGGPPHEPDDRG